MPGRAPASPGGKAWRQSATLPLLPACPRGLFPHTPALGRRLCGMGISVNSQQTPPSTPVLPPPAEGRTDPDLSIQDTP